MEPVVHLRSAVTLLGRFPALAGVDLDVFPGEVVLLRGPNGAGKTTLLRLCAGLAPVSSGLAVVLGVDLSRDRGGVRRRVGLLGHATFLYDDLSVTENVDFWARASGASVADGRAALERLGVAGRLHGLPVHALSAGQRRRVSFAAMVARRPELWLLDEPHAGLDAGGRDVVDGLMREAASVGATVMFASHELDRAGDVADRAVTVAGGVVVPGRSAVDEAVPDEAVPDEAVPDEADRGSRPVMRDAALIAGKDLRLEWRSKVGVGQVLPFALLVILLFVFALDPDRGVLERATSGLYWVVVMFSSILTVERAFSIEADDGIFDALRLSGLAPAAIYLGKVAALVLQLLILEAVLAVAVAVFYDTRFTGIGLVVAVALIATLGIAGVGAVYGAVAARLRTGATLLPLLLLPLLAPVLIAATRGFEVALGREAGPGWPWAALLGIFALIYLTLGALLFRPLLEDT